MSDSRPQRASRTLINRTYQQAVRVLLDNSYNVRLNGTSYQHTLPSRDFYVHQWNWDSATHAMGLVHIDPTLAYEEIRSLLAGQWANGHIAQITFNPNESKYFPGSQFWGTDRFRNGEIITSGITQPPLLAIAVNYVYRHSFDHESAARFLADTLPCLERYHNYLKELRDIDDSGLVTVIHPWESGTDNSPRWDKPLQAISLSAIPAEVKNIVDSFRSDVKYGNSDHRPRLEDYYRYMYLVHRFSEQSWEYPQIVQTSPFAVKDILFNSIWCRANDALAETLEISGWSNDAHKYRVWASQTRNALECAWDDDSESYCDIDVADNKNEIIRENTIASLIPLWAHVPLSGRLHRLLERLADPEQYWTPSPVPTTARNSPKFDPSRYWRGPTWPITNVFVIEGLNMYRENSQCVALRDALVDKTLSIIAENGFFEYYDPLRGSTPGGPRQTGLGFGAFSWSASIYIYLLGEYRAELLENRSPTVPY